MLALSAAGLIGVGASPAFADGTPPSSWGQEKAEKKDKKDERKVRGVDKDSDDPDKTVINNIDQDFEYELNIIQGVDEDEIHNTNGLVNVNDNNTQAIVQICNNDVPVNVLGVLVRDVAVLLGLDEEGEAENDDARNCEQGSAQQDGDNEVEAAAADDEDGVTTGGGGDEEIHNTNGLVNINDNNTQIPLQICNNDVPVNVLGVLVEDATLALGLDEENSAENDDARNCEQGQAQQNGDNEVNSGGNGGGGDEEIHNTNGLVNINDNNTQIPLQICNNDVPVNVLGVLVEDVTLALGLDEGVGAGSDEDRNCEQGSAQQDGDNSAEFDGLAGLVGGED